MHFAAQRPQQALCRQLCVGGRDYTMCTRKHFECCPMMISGKDSSSDLSQTVPPSTILGKKKESSGGQASMERSHSCLHVDFSEEFHSNKQMNNQ